MEMRVPGFYQFQLSVDQELFGWLETSIEFEELGKGRRGNHLVAAGPAGIPMVRTTTQYQRAAFPFAPLHQAIADGIRQASGKMEDLPDAAPSFNNALIEIYDPSYSSMKYHSDQALDLAEGSYIALFSCYEQPHALTPGDLRKLKVKPKGAEAEYEFTLHHNSVILFSLAINSQYLHKIVLEAVKGAKPSPENRWLGITFRQSRTMIHFQNGQPHFASGTPLLLADEAQRKEFYALRGEENRQIAFQYPDLPYTLSPADLLPPAPLIPDFRTLPTFSWNPG